MIVNCLNCGKSVSSNMRNCPYCKWECEEALLREMTASVVQQNYKEILKNKLKGAILGVMLRYAHK
ncbi:MAG: hypothetical protein US89_C0011G0021 [Candidatus Peregrinibacteria bacterium GW2011_GWF2_38_29]|nr:MAG: hypothetical protein US89_C0011G0021 [Candidatus Peregrinibacteria bacterium GW2011_GWF2_38_29]KKQ71509.1 MAG: hypothetical protein US92_C0005G0100 [Candidatus Peregrinibacteria bacterium GW2011_GWA2_38_36]KKR06649.1 MAG: hypothetical protein UT33_C0009G0100 [Candidatus Peregrinibacteria bacterium GW2011_GWC2_39_14]